jgi:uracil phosphoribosyltransferase
VAILKTWGIKHVKIVSAIASKQGLFLSLMSSTQYYFNQCTVALCKTGLQDLYSKHPDVEVYLAAIDPSLTEVRLLRT